jgi:hypothetical protein
MRSLDSLGIIKVSFHNFVKSLHHFIVFFLELSLSQGNTRLALRDFLFFELAIRLPSSAFETTQEARTLNNTKGTPALTSRLGVFDESALVAAAESAKERRCVTGAATAARMVGLPCSLALILLTRS